ncbi:hypothetical protein T10_12726 [Trichinella papuae]|uniref:Uncharacterized protein n=1 Tax=Trichinella papuae TaxID=268474 RepID=A0A0V1MCN1_9BILA|nr:hypothetical protein T10_12726 [Trichinella papuae]
MATHKSVLISRLLCTETFLLFTTSGAYVLFCSCGCANLPDGCWSKSHTMNIPKRNFSGRKPLPLEYNQFLSQAGRPAEAQLGKSGRSNLAPECWESCLEWPASRLFRNHKQISPDQVGRQVLPLWNGALQLSGYTWADLI